MTEAIGSQEPEVFVLKSKAGKAFGPCASCAFFNERGTKATHMTGRCHGGPPSGGLGFAVVKRDDPGCAVYVVGR
jgi:hypothetical protein